MHGTFGSNAVRLVVGTGQSNAALLGGSLVRAELWMISLDTGVTRQIAVAFDFAAMARIAGLGVSDLPLVANDGVNLFLRRSAQIRRIELEHLDVRGCCLPWGVGLEPHRL